MGLAAVVAWFALALPLQQEPGGASAGSGDVPVTIPGVLSARPPLLEAPEVRPAAGPAPARQTIPTEEPPRAPRPLVDRPESGPGIAGFIVGSFAVLGLLGGAFLVLRRFGKNSRLLAAAGAIKVLARKPLGPKQEIFLVEVGTRVFMIGSTRDHLSALGEFASPDEVAVLRANLPQRKDDSLRGEFHQSLREGLRGEEGSPSGGPPREERVFASIADELAEIRKTVRAWRA
jgi:flagellar biosynthetic protein FliO